jgi:hypothetical protein
MATKIPAGKQADPPEPNASGPRIAEQLAELVVPLDSVTRFPGNPRRGDIPVIRGSLRDYGQYKPIVVQKSTGYVLAGNQTHIARGEEGGTHIAAVFVDVDDLTAKRILAMDNRAGDLGGYDELALAELLRELQGSDGGLDGTGYTDDDLTDLLDKLADDAEGEDGGDAPIENPAQVWGVIVNCKNEREQADLLQRLDGEGYQVRALM